MTFIAENRIAHVIKMRHLRVVEDDAVFKFARVAHHNAVADDHVLADVTAVANLAALANPRRAFDHRALLDRGSFSDKNRAAHKWLADQPSFNSRLEPELQITRNLFQRIPNIR